MTQKPCIICVAITGSVPTKADNPAVPTAVAEQVAQLGHLDLRGLMCMARFGADEAELRRTFAALRELRDQLSDRLQHPLPELSMGMSGDFEAAIEEGATLIRVGTAIFGEREPPPADLHG